jgi:hypothetical protein
MKFSFLIIYGTSLPYWVIVYEISKCLCFRKIGLDLFYSAETTYFSLLTSAQRKIWIIEEQYRRTKLGFKLLSDSAFVELQSEVGQPNNIADYPFNYDLLFSREY